MKRTLTETCYSVLSLQEAIDWSVIEVEAFRAPGP